MISFWLIICLVGIILLGIYFILGGVKGGADGNLRLLEKIKRLEARAQSLDEEIRQLDDQIAVEQYLALKKKVGRLVHKGFIAEVFFTFKGNERLYLLTGYSDCVTFKRFSIINFYDESGPCLDGEEIRCKYMDDMFQNDLIDSINLRRDWNKIIKFKVYKRKVHPEDKR